MGKRPELKLVVPETLKVMLVDDWEAVTKNMQVCLFDSLLICLVFLDEFVDGRV